MDPALIKDIGFPIFLSLLLLGAFGYVSKWLATNVVKPMVGAHISLVSDLKEHTKKTSEFVAVTSETLKKMEDAVSVRHNELKSLLMRNESRSNGD